VKRRVVEENPPEDHYLDVAWLSLGDLDRETLERRHLGETLASIANDFGVTREWVRQIQLAGTNELVECQQRCDPGLEARLKESVGTGNAHEPDVAKIVGHAASIARDVVLSKIGLVNPVLDGVAVPFMWTFDPHNLDRKFAALMAVMPCSDDEARAAAEDVSLPAGMDWATWLERDGSLVVRHDLGWIRRKKQARDVAYLWLRAEGEPRSLDDLWKASGAKNQHAFRELLRRDEVFVQVKPEGTWALVDWRLPGTDGRYNTALDAVVEVIRDLGAMDFERLQTETRQRYPVTVWRVQQCLASNLIGQTDEGLIDLVERGARPIEDEEPKRPPHVQVSGSMVGISIPVDHDVVRGSGIAVHRWLTWYLGLRTAPTSRYFAFPEGHGDLTVRRGLSLSQVSSLRTQAAWLGASEGCTLTLLLRTDSNTADLLHACAQGECTSRLKTRLRLLEALQIGEPT
jgi:hypothetical protein